MYGYYEYYSRDIIDSMLHKHSDDDVVRWIDCMCVQ